MRTNSAAQISPILEVEAEEASSPFVGSHNKNISPGKNEEDQKGANVQKQRPPTDFSKDAMQKLAK